MGSLFTELMDEREKQKQELERMSEEQERPKKDVVSPTFVPVEDGQNEHRFARRQGTQETRKQVSQEAKKNTSHPAYLEPDSPSLPDMYRKQTFEFGEQELAFLDDVKLDCKREYGIRVTKNQIIRAALELLRKEFEENKETSFLVRKFSGK